MSNELPVALIWVNFITCLILSFSVLHYTGMVKSYNSYLTSYIRKLVSLEIDVSKLLMKQMEDSLRLSRDISLSVSPIEEEEDTNNGDEIIGMEKSPLLEAVKSELAKELTKVEYLV